MESIPQDAPNIDRLKLSYCRAFRCWRANDLRSCTNICNDLTHHLSLLETLDDCNLVQLKHLVWYLKIRCLAEDYQTNESLLLNEDDIENTDSQVQTVGATTRQASKTARFSTASIRKTPLDRIPTTTMTSETRGRHQRPTTAILTGRMPSVSSRQSGRATSSYRPLTTSLTATQTAFSRSTRPILRYSPCRYLSKLLYEYLYNTQTVNNKCPDYRQCLEYLNSVQSAARQSLEKQRQLEHKKKSQNPSGWTGRQDEDIALVHLLDDDTVEDRKALGAYWLISFGICYFNLHMNKQAEVYFQHAKTVNPLYLDPYAWLIKVYLRSNQPARVLKTCEEGLANSRNSILYNWMARAQSLLYDSYTANLSLRESLNYYPTNIEALSNVGYFSFYGDKLEQSLKCFERINQLTANQFSTSITSPTNDCSYAAAYDHSQVNSMAELLNNLALCNYYCGHQHKVIPLFQRAFLCSPNKEVTSNIWYNVSFVPLGCGFKNLAMACLRLALKNNPNNQEAINNLGVLKYDQLINDPTNYENRPELWPGASPVELKVSEPLSAAAGNDESTKKNAINELTANGIDLKNFNDQNRRQQQMLFDDCEAHFSLPSLNIGDIYENITPMIESVSQPEILFNMALVKRRRGHLLASAHYCKLYLLFDENNYTIHRLLREIEQLILHDG